MASLYPQSTSCDYNTSFIGTDVGIKRAETSNMSIVPSDGLAWMVAEVQGYRNI